MCFMYKERESQRKRDDVNIPPSFTLSPSLNIYLSLPFPVSLSWYTFYKEKNREREIFKYFLYKER